MSERVVVLGAGFGGLELCSTLSEALGDEADVTLIDKSDGFVFGFSKLDVMFGRTSAAAVHHPYRDIVKPGVRFLQSTVRSIDPAAGRIDRGGARRRAIRRAVSGRQRRHHSRPALEGRCAAALQG